MLGNRVVRILRHLHCSICNKMLSVDSATTTDPDCPEMVRSITTSTAPWFGLTSGSGKVEFVVACGDNALCLAALLCTCEPETDTPTEPPDWAAPLGVAFVHHPDCAVVAARKAIAEKLQ